MNIWNAGLDIACHCSLTQAYNIQPESLLGDTYTKYKLMYYLKHRYVPIISNQGMSLVPPTKISCSQFQLLSYCEKAIESVRTLVINKEKNQTKEIQEFWETKMICPLTKTAFYCAVSDSKGHLFEKKAIEEHLKNRNRCPVSEESITSEMLHYHEYTNDLVVRLLLPLLPSMRGMQVINDTEKLNRSLQAAKVHIQNKEYDLALGMYVEACKYTDRSEDYEEIPLLFLSMDQPLKAALAYLYLAQKQLREEKIEAVENSICKAFELAPQDEIALLRAEYQLLIKERKEAGSIFCELAKKCHEKKEALWYFEQALACARTDVQMYKTITSYLDDDDVKVRLNLIAFASLYKKQPQLALEYYDEACLLQPGNPLIYLARLCRMKDNDPKRENLYSTLADIFIDQKDSKRALYCLEWLCIEYITTNNLKRLEKVWPEFVKGKENAIEILFSRIPNRWAYFETFFKIAEVFERLGMKQKGARIYYDLSVLAYSEEALDRVSSCNKKIKITDPIFSAEEREIIAMHTTTLKMFESVERLTQRLKQMELTLLSVDLKGRIADNGISLQKGLLGT